MTRIGQLQRLRVKEPASEDPVAKLLEADTWSENPFKELDFALKKMVGVRVKTREKLGKGIIEVVVYPVEEEDVVETHFLE